MSILFDLVVGQGVTCQMALKEGSTHRLNWTIEAMIAFFYKKKRTLCGALVFKFQL
jgi:hypothetical protein